MISFTQGNLVDADVEAVVNTVNTKGIMGKGIALMFKDKFPANFEAYARACKRNEVRIGEMFVTKHGELFGPAWIINFPTKTHWRVNTRPEWIKEGLRDLVRVIKQEEIRSIAVPPLGCGNGGLEWALVRPLIVDALEGVEGLDAMIYEPTEMYQNVAKRKGVEKLTPARALVAEMVRRYCLLGIDCSILEVQKLAWFIERGVQCLQVEDPLRLEFKANKYGPYSHKLSKLLDSLDGSYLHCDKRLADAGPFDLIWFNDAKEEHVNYYLTSGEGKVYAGVLEWASRVIDGFESPLGMELLATVDWLLEREGVAPTIAGVKKGLSNWAGVKTAGQRKLRLLNDRLIGIALDQLTSTEVAAHS